MVTTSNFARIMDNNSAELVDASIIFSSELTAYPATNSVTRFRNEQWRAKGNFTVDSSNSAIYITVDSVSTTVALTAGDYTYENFASHISTRLNEDSSGWSCSYDFSGGTFKFTISNSNSVTLNFSSTTNAAWDTLGYKSTTDELNTTFEADQQRNHTEEYLTFDLGYAGQITTFFTIGTLDEVFSISSEATIFLKGNNINDNWDNSPLSINLADYKSDTGIYSFIDSILTDTRYRFWSFRINDRMNALGPEEAVKISHVYLGTYTTLDDYNINNSFQKVVIDETVRTQSEGGSLYFDNRTKYTVFNSVGYGFLDKTSRETLEKLYNRIGTSIPVYVSLDPNLKISSQLDDLTIYCVYNNSPTMSHVIYDKFNYSIEFREVK